MPQLLSCSPCFFPISSIAFLVCLCSVLCVRWSMCLLWPLTELATVRRGDIKLSFVTQPAEEGVPPDLGFTNREGLVIDVMTGGHLVHSDHKMIRIFSSQRSKDECQKNCYCVGFPEGSFSLFRRLDERRVSRVPESKGDQEACTFFKKEISMVQE